MSSLSRPKPFISTMPARRNNFARLGACRVFGFGLLVFFIPAFLSPLAFGAGAQEPGIILRDVIKRVDILFMESFPLQLQVEVRGELPDLCTEVGAVKVRREEETFFITIPVSKPSEAVCALVLMPFRRNIPLDIYGLKAGTYTVNVNGLVRTFTLERDNVMPEVY